MILKSVSSASSAFKNVRAEKINIPIVVIGGINKDTVPLFSGIGIDGIAVVSAIVAYQDATSAAQELKALFQGGV